MERRQRDLQLDERHQRLGEAFWQLVLTLVGSCHLRF